MILCESEKKIVQFHEKILNDVETFFCVKTLICSDFWHCSNFPKKIDPNCNTNFIALHIIWTKIALLQTH